MKKPRPAKSIGRKRRAAGWTLLTLGVLVAGVWVASAICTPRGGTRTVRAAVHRGVLYAFVSNRSYHAPSLRGGRIVLLSDEVWAGIEQDPRGLELTGSDPALRTRVQACAELVPGPLILPLWPVSLALVSCGPLLLWFAKRAVLRSRQGYCATCGYSLAGIAKGSPCPECGKRSALSSPPT